MKSGAGAALFGEPVSGQLRAVRDQYLVEKAAQPGLHPGDGLLATNLDLMVFVYMRDAIPYEDAQGLLAF